METTAAEPEITSSSARSIAMASRAQGVLVHVHLAHSGKVLSLESTPSTRCALASAPPWRGGAELPEQPGQPTNACCPPARPPCSVSAVQQALASLTGIALPDQILMCDGTRLEGEKPLSAYGLPGVQAGRAGEAAEDAAAPAPRDVFLFHRGHLRPGAPLPPPETLPDFDAEGVCLRDSRAALPSFAFQSLKRVAQNVSRPPPPRPCSCCCRAPR